MPEDDDMTIDEAMALLAGPLDVPPTKVLPMPVEESDPEEAPLAAVGITKRTSLQVAVREKSNIDANSPIMWEKWPHDSKASDEDKKEAAKALLSEMVQTGSKTGIMPRNGCVFVAEKTQAGIVMYECEIRRKAIVT